MESSENLSYLSKVMTYHRIYCLLSREFLLFSFSLGRKGDWRLILAQQLISKVSQKINVFSLGTAGIAAQIHRSLVKNLRSLYEEYESRRRLGGKQMA